MNNSLQDLIVNWSSAVANLNSGGVGVLPTDTVYGLVASAANKQAVDRMYQLKHRDHKPGTIVAANIEQLIDLGVSKAQLQKVAHLWPNPLSIEISLGKHLNYLHQETGRQAFRVVKDKRLRTILEQTGPLLTSSANDPGQPGANTVAEAFDYFKDKVDFYVDGGDLTGRQPSTIAKLTANGLHVIRAGAVKLDASQ